MVDRRHIVDLWHEGAARVLVTLVRIQGSSYRRAGAHLLIAADSTHYAGVISGGCLESEVIRKAAWLIQPGPVVKRYSTLFDDTAEIPFGLGCGGVVDLLFEPADTPEAVALLTAMESSLTGAEFRIHTWLPEGGSALARAVFTSSGDLIFSSASLRPQDLQALAVSPAVFVEDLSPPQRLFVLGAGDDARPVVAMAAQLGWRVIVADGRAHLVRPDRFPAAESVIATTSVAELGFRASDAVVLMTHSYEQDRAHLAGLLSGQEVPGYIGLLGASHRSSLLISEAAALIGASIAACCERVWAPVGLDLGGDGAEAIALALIAEVHAWREGRLGGPRRLTPERIAEQVAKGGASLYLRSQCAVAAE